MKNKSIVLLSGGLDSVVSLAHVYNSSSEILALTFNYGQKSFKSEKIASGNIARFYKIKRKIIDLNWLKDISNSALNNSCEVPVVNECDLDNIDFAKKNAELVWVPNRNGLFVNIAACFAEALGYNQIVIGANKEEAATFKDNSVNFINSVNSSLKFSSDKDATLIAPLIDMNKEQIVKQGLELEIPFNLIFSCYNGYEKHCGKCESCMRLKRALEFNNRYDIIKQLFD